MPTSEIRELPEERCWELLAQHDVGRLAVSVMNRPDIFPVNYVVADESIVVRSAPGQKFAAATLGTAVAFEVDALDEATKTGWSIVCKGPAESIENLAEWIEAQDLDIDNWAPGSKQRFLRIVPESVTGRIISRQGAVRPSCLIN